MSKITDEEIKSIGVVEAAIADGYWEERAIQDAKYLYTKGLLDATLSIYRSSISAEGATGRNVRNKIKRLRSELKNYEEIK